MPALSTPTSPRNPFQWKFETLDSPPLVGGDEGERGRKLNFITLTPTLSRQGRGEEVGIKFNF